MLAALRCQVDMHSMMANEGGLDLLFCVTEAKPAALASKVGSDSGQRSTSKGAASEIGSNNAAGKTQSGSVKTEAANGGGTLAGGSLSVDKAAGKASLGSAVERESASPSMKKQANTVGTVQQVKTRADGQLTQGVAAASDVAGDGKTSGGSVHDKSLDRAVIKEKPLNSAAVEKDGIRGSSVTGSQKTASNEQASSESLEQSGERVESGEAAVEGIGAARLQAAKG